jgi:putative DNA primase/helicase
MKISVHHDPGMLHQTCEKVLEAQSDFAVEDGIYQFGGALVEVAQSKKSTNQAGIKRPKNAFTLKTMTAPAICRAFSRHVQITKHDGRSKTKDDPNAGLDDQGDPDAGKKKVVDFPKSIADGILSLPILDPIPEIVGICQAAFLGADGTEYATPGYHPAPKVLLVSGSPLKPAPGVAGRSKGTEGLKKIKHLLRGFNFKDDGDLSAAIAGIMTALNRKSMPAAPMFQVTAPAAGTGKSKYVDVAAIIATGTRAAVLAIGRDESEFAKRFAGVLAQGDPLVSFDNVTREFGKEDILLQALTQTHVLIRLLGASSIMKVPTLTTFFATGNNLRPVSDLKRRSCLIRMDAGVERPEHRNFKFDVLDEALTNRDALIRAAIDISASYLEAGAQPVFVQDDAGNDEPLKPAGSFEIWDLMIRRALVWHGMPDPLKSAETLRELDPELEATQMLIDAWYRNFQDNQVKAGDVIERAIAKINSGGDNWELQNQDLNDALHFVCQDNINARRLGNWMRKSRDFIVNGKRIVQAGRDSHANTMLWKVEIV